jgi:hypothetical protein
MAVETGKVAPIPHRIRPLLNPEIIVANEPTGDPILVLFNV